MVEQDLEQKMKDELGMVLDTNEVQIVSSWSAKENEFNADQNCVLSIYISPRQHDSFSLPTVTIDGAIGIDFRLEKYPTMSGVSEVFQVVQDKLDDWHYDATEFSRVFSNDQFFATELKLSGGTRVSLDRSNGIWTVGLNFQIRGTVFHTAENSISQ